MSQALAACVKRASMADTFFFDDEEKAVQECGAASIFKDVKRANAKSHASAAEWPDIVKEAARSPLVSSATMPSA
jgi:hypothetical protein